MPLFLTILEGERPEEAEPLIATGDERLINAVIKELIRRVTEKHPPLHQGATLQLVPAKTGRDKSPEKEKS